MSERSAHNASGYGIGCQAICIIIIQERVRPNKFHHLTCECAHTLPVGIVLVVRPYVRTPYI